MKLCFLILITLFIYSCVSSEKIISDRVVCRLSLGKGFEKNTIDEYHSDLITYTRNNNERLFVIIGTSEFKINLPPEMYENDNFWNLYKIHDTITLQGTHNGLYWKQIKFYKDQKPSIGYDGVSKEKISEFENYIKSFSCKKR